MFENPNTGKFKKAPVGFSWTTLFCLGPFPALLRGDWKWFTIMVITFPLASVFVFMFIYNKLYIRDLVKAGFKAKSISKGDLGFAEGTLKMKLPRIE